MTAPRARLFFSFQILSCLILLQLKREVVSDRSDEICKIIESKRIEPSNDSLPSEPDNFFRDRIVQKSLLIVFDGTSSMGDDLAQMVPAAKEIIETFHERKEKPIKNFVLTVFKDPSKMRVEML